MSAKLLTNFRRFSDMEFKFHTGTIVTSLTGNTRFPSEWPAPASSIAVLTQKFDRYCEALHLSLSRDVGRIRERNEARAELTDELMRLVPYLEFAAAGDEAVLRSTGFELHRDRVRADRSEPLDAPGKLQLSHGAFSGEVDVRIGRVEGARSYELQVAQADPGVEGNWRHAQSSAVLRVTLRDLSPRQDCWVRVRGIQGASAGRWCEPSSIVVL